MIKESNLPTAEMFKTIPRESSLSSRVEYQIENMIIQNHLQPGDHLPAERELARQFGVSRTVVREAVRALVAKSLLDVRPGSGTVVRVPTAQSLTQSIVMFLRGGQAELDYKKVLEVRRILEVEIAGLAAERRTAKDLQDLEEIIRAGSRVQNDRYQFAKFDVAFHTALAYATQNRLFPLLLDSVAEIMIELRRMALDMAEAPARAYYGHRAIFGKVGESDSEGARQAMHAHLLETEELIELSVKQHAGRVRDDDNRADRSREPDRVPAGIQDE